jgi:hypothetical protein
MTVNTDYNRHATPDDPTAINLEPIKARLKMEPDLRLHGPGLLALIAAVEALREKVASQETRHGLYKHVAKSVRGALDGEHTQRDILRIFDEQIAGREAAEAREAALAKLIQVILDVAADATVLDAWRKEARAALAATPEQALKRARAVQKVAGYARHTQYCDLVRNPPETRSLQCSCGLGSALAALNALGKE